MTRIGIIGAGIAGLTAADWLSAAGCDVAIYEARERPGGRLHTLSSPFSPVPIELGAEFIHGDQNETWKILEKHSHFHPVEFPDRHWKFQDNKLTENKHFWDDLGNVMEGLAHIRRDVSFQTYLQTQHPLRRLRSLAKDYVEGFHAAEPTQVSVVSLEESEEAAEKTHGQKAFRLAEGYGSLVDWLTEKLRSRGVAFHFNHAIKRVQWRKGCVQLYPDEKDFIEYNALLVTVPIGVLQAKPEQIGALQFEPDIPTHRSLFEKLRMGNVLKLTLVFKKAFWRETVFGFVHAHHEKFPTWWTAKESNVLVGWAGGPKADNLNNKSRDEIVRSALVELSKIFGLLHSEIKSLLLESYVYDWRNDPFARGTYSYLPVGASNIPQQLAQPIEETLFFAGEALAPPGQIGTVHGAMNSGKAAAWKILKFMD